MRILIFSDLHAHLFRPYATILPNGMNSRLVDAVNCVKQIIDYVAIHPEIDLVLFGGDLFHTRGRLAVQAFNAIYEVLSGFSLRKVPTVLIHGNHDQADREGSVYSIHTLRTICTVVDQPGWVMVAGHSQQLINLMAVPYTENLAHLRDLVKEPAPAPGPRIFLGHLGLQGAKVGADFVYANPHDAVVADLNPAGFDAGFLGHFHTYQPVGHNFHYIGAPLQHTWGDSGDPRGFLIYDTETKAHERVLLRAPRFVHIVENEQVDVEDCYVRMTASRAYSEDEAELARRAYGARSLEVVVADVPHTNGVRVAIEHGMSYRDMIQRWVGSGVQPVEGLDSDYLVQLALEILQEVEDT